MTRAAWVVGNSPYYQALTAMAKELGFQVPLSFNTDYDKNLPQARGQVLLIETHRGTPILAQQTLEQHYPGASQALSMPGMTLRLGDGTTIVFVDFSLPLAHLA